MSDPSPSLCGWGSCALLHRALLNHVAIRDSLKEAHRWLSKAEQTGHNQASKAKSVLNAQLDAETRQLLEKNP